VRVILVGTDSERARLRARANASLEIVGECATIPAAHATEIDYDAILIAPTDHASDDDRYNDHIEEPLTPREVQVLELLAEGLSNKGIAGRLAISDQTVKFHVASISGKLGAANRTDAVRRAVRRGLITL
jgi:DNA-binding NarL/FixJ family response regulator